MFASFDWEVHSVDATQYDGVYAALEQFRYGPRNGKPTAIICHGTKGHGALSDFLNKHKVTVPDAAARAGARAAGRAAARSRRRVQRVPSRRSAITRTATRCRTRCSRCARHDAPRRRPTRSPATLSLDAGRSGRSLTARAPPRDKRIRYDAALLPTLDRGEAVRRQRHRHRGDEGVRARSARRVDRFRPGDDQRPRSRRGGGRSAARAERRRRRSQHDGHRRGVRRARLPDVDQHVLPVLRLEGACGASRSAIRSGSRRWRRRTAG